MSEKIASAQNQLIKHVVKLQNDRAYRYAEKEVVIEGHKMILELPSLKTLFVTNEQDVRSDCQSIVITSEIMKKISSVATSEGVLAIVPMPPFSSLESKNTILVLDGINDPGNLGTLLRTALSFGWEGVFLLENCCDPFNGKALRAAKGATFRIPLAQGNSNDLPKSHQVFVADLEGQAPETFSPSEKRMLILGSESQGVSPECQQLGQKVTLPISEMESLNVAVAGGILMYLFKPNQKT
ncbi:MAG: putative TrmH family tRNA/rRNA methyltransferase [Chlamydiae bacterium]|nr:putative TrmH family tRNA/rRNA methyltransferase [Chlamydiota bacterium]